ncbi:PE-PGRS family protein PE_PGRS16 [Mycobacterium simulans]|uniref:PE-PGRS family protein PE_PGRS16 n=1 Tax=Mycobacterium simulans TaxID=627089 RepID=A0A7Z7IPI0_9MYCO|nr:PE family protein [Mycobacterium simulans]SOJ57420.1 PE-PGRS family protein PE_PGRS16 [Mycobacterium simulans]
MSYVSVDPQVFWGAAGDVARIGAQLGAANTAAAVSTTQLVAASADEVSVAIAALFGAHAQQYQVLSAQAAAWHDGFVDALTGAGVAYAGVEATNVSPLQILGQDVLGVINAPTEALLGRPLIGDGANGTAANPNGQAGGLLYGNGGAGYSYIGGATAAAGGAGPF